ncbi:MAG: tetratricopeptide repeat protein, partial [Anaerolineae bacterium]|nr:tetratricopeptide repeat protein [Anaerolineae bacterium]
ERVGRLREELQDILTVASVEGEAFTAQVVAQVQDIAEREMLQALSQELRTRHRLVREREEMLVEGRFLSHYQFAHALFQRYLYSGLGAGERRLLHGEIATALEELYGDEAEGIAPQLARHYAEAGEGEKAADYSSCAGDQARLAYAHEEAIDHYRRALAFLKEGGEHGRAARTLMKLGLTYHTAFDFQQARQAYEEGFALWQRAGEMEPTALQSAPHALRSWQLEPVTLDPIRASELLSAAIIRQLFSGLVDASPELDVVPDVARTWEVLEGGRKYVFHLRDDVRWSDGTPVTAEDFAYAWRRALDPVTGSRNAHLLYDVKGARAFHRGQVSDPNRVGVRPLDAVTLAVELEQPTGHFLQLLTHYATYPLPQHVVAVHEGAWTEVGKIVTNGPFKLEAWNRGESMVLVRNLKYHGRFEGNVQREELSFLTDWSAALAMYEVD